MKKKQKPIKKSNWHATISPANMERVIDSLALQWLDACNIPEALRIAVRGEIMEIINRECIAQKKRFDKLKRIKAKK